MRIDILTIFPGMFDGPFGCGIVNRAREKGLVEININNLRDFSQDKHKRVDDYPYGGGAGMVFRPEPIVGALNSLNSDQEGSRSRVIFLSAQGRTLNQALLNELSLENHLVLLCGHYKGVDERVIEKYVTDEISIGDYVLSGGEPAAVVITDAVVRLIPEAISDFESAMEDSFQDGLLDCPWYTRPAEFEGMKVPRVVLSGDHKKIKEWRRRESIRRTLQRRPDLLKRARLSDEDREILQSLTEQEDLKV